MGMRGAKHRFMPNRLVFPGGAVDRADLDAPCATELSPHTAALLRKSANAALAHGLGIAAARELQEETGLSLGAPPQLDVLNTLAARSRRRSSPIRFNARFLLVHAAASSGTLAGDGELERLRYYGVHEALALDLAMPTRRVTGAAAHLACDVDDSAAAHTQIRARHGGARDRRLADGIRYAARHISPSRMHLAFRSSFSRCASTLRSAARRSRGCTCEYSASISA